MADLGYTKLNGKICCNKCKEYVCGVRFIFACALLRYYSVVAHVGSRSVTKLSTIAS